MERECNGGPLSEILLLCEREGTHWSSHCPKEEEIFLWITGLHQQESMCIIYSQLDMCTVEPLLYKDTAELGHLSKQDTFSHPKYICMYHSCLHFNL